MSDEVKPKKPRKKKAAKVEDNSAPVFLSESDLNYNDLASLANILKRGGRLVTENKRLLLELSPITGRRMQLHKYERVRIGATVDEIAKVKIGPSDKETELPREDMLPDLKKIEATIREMQAQKTRVRFEAE
jgi:hypothetical protein